MARQLWLLRHGDAEALTGGSDFDRELTERGRDQARLAGRAMVALELAIDAAFTSPRVRARQTAERCCAELGIEPVTHDPLSIGFGRDDALGLLAAVSGDQRVLIVGHEPDFSQVVHGLTGAQVEFKKGGLAGVRLEGTTGGELMALLRPRELARIAASLD